ncbi:deoxyinosine 3'endonuclease (endonuclease V)-like protein [Formosa agariphila KMM 3901]|uniref:Deoxyinosine 3'endonuclease (Endonuclease V)-like protein n=1 Tax=Formosa agariphila (strain DSM 15362 / KCTC 12365 / LMG 23005 / KMM 3901 / M-2Alg 35-1) TaxID=1347342 RepID=T2KNN8_FORAG|nr:endonuclease V [Formosa agariphila]CDF79609.1 deoxyinosine 3'endonuclease (endonuclease V)-like protein [Formosa agariphila KMM 3901]
MILAFDTYYYDGKAKTIAVSFNDWEDEAPTQIFTDSIEVVEPYEPGAFYKRELPCILSLLKQVNLDEVELIIVDGYVILEEKHLGLGGFLYQALEHKIPVVGIAKSEFVSKTAVFKEVFRGESKKPLYVTAIGTDRDEVCNAIERMHGKYRMPTLLQIVDTKTKENTKH